MQETFVRGMTSLSGFRGESPRSWLFAIARNVFIDDANRRRREEFGVLADQTSTRDSDMTEVLAIRDALDSLPEIYRSALVLRDQIGFSYEEVSSILGKSLPATKVLIHRARAAFRKAYEES